MAMLAFEAQRLIVGRPPIQEFKADFALIT
jgi:hypothetical protein